MESSNRGQLVVKHGCGVPISKQSLEDLSSQGLASEGLSFPSSCGGGESEDAREISEQRGFLRRLSHVETIPSCQFLTGNRAILAISSHHTQNLVIECNGPFLNKMIYTKMDHLSQSPFLEC